MSVIVSGGQKLHQFQQPWTQQDMSQIIIHHGQNKVMMQWRQWLGRSSFTRTITLSLSPISSSSPTIASLSLTTTGALSIYSHSVLCESPCTLLSHNTSMIYYNCEYWLLNTRYGSYGTTRLLPYWMWTPQVSHDKFYSQGKALNIHNTMYTTTAVD